MALSPEKLKKILRAGDPTGVVKFFRGSNEAERQSVTPVVKQWCELLELNWRASFNKKAAERLTTKEKIKNTRPLEATANLAALACLSLAQVKTAILGERPDLSLIGDVLRDRRPAWLDDYAESLCEGELRRWRAERGWREVRYLVSEGLCRAPKHQNYALGAIHGIWRQIKTSKQIRQLELGKPPPPEPNLADLLFAEKDWLEDSFWRLFEIEGTGEISLANSGKFNQHDSTWATAIVELSRRDVLPRDRLLDASLSALSRDFIQFRAGWFSHFHEAMSPTIDEREARLPVYFQLLGSAIPPTVTFALKSIQRLDKERPIAGAQLTRHLESALAARSKVAVTGALQLLDRAARREERFAQTAAHLATLALFHESPEVQEKALALVEKHGNPRNTELRAKLSGLGGHIAPSLRKRLAAWLGETASVETQPLNAPDPMNAALQTPPSRIDPARAITPIATLDELILVASAMIESPDNPTDIERVLDGLSRLGVDRPADFDKRLGPLRKRALKKRDDKSGRNPSHPNLDRTLAMLLLTWTEGKDGFAEGAIELAGGQNHFAFLFRRLQELGKLLCAGRSLPLLSTPTHRGGWIDPCVLVDRWLFLRHAGVEPSLHEQVLALLRLAPENREAALSAARVLKGESGEALRLALGAHSRIGENAALWLAAWRCRQPLGDLPEFERIHPKLGPDAGEAARYDWTCRGEHHEHESFKWNTFEISFSTQPKLPNKIGDAMLPVLFHGGGGSQHSSFLNRWAATLSPGHRESFFAQAIKSLAWSLNSEEIRDSDVGAWLESLADMHTEMRPMATLALALGLAATDPSLRGNAQEGLITAIAQDRLDVPALAAVMSRLLETGINKFARWAKALSEAARVSPWHAARIADLLRQALRGDPAKAPRDIHALLELLVELLAETGAPLNDAEAKQYLGGIKAGGRTAKLVKQLLV